MKKLLALLIALTMILALAACGNSQANAPAEEPAAEEPAAEEPAEEAPAEEPAGEEPAPEGQLTVGIAMPTNSLERWNRDGKYLQEQFEAAGYSAVLKYSDNDIDQQNNDIQTMIADGVNLLIIVAIDGESLTQTLEEAKDAGIPVIAYDRLIMNSDAVSYYVSFDNYTVGTLQGTFVRDALDLDNAEGPFNIEFTAGDPADNNAGYFFNGAFDVLSPYIDEGKLVVQSGQTTFEQVATQGWATDKAMTRFQDILGSYYTDAILDVALCSNDSTALGVAKAIESDYAGGNQPIVTGQDGDEANLKNIVDGQQTMTVYKNVSDEAGVTLEVAKVILAGGTPDASLVSSLSVEAAYDTESYDNDTSEEGENFIPSFLLVPWTVTVDNLQDLVDTGLYEWAGEYVVPVN